MKIIAKTDGDYLVQATAAELMKILGREKYDFAKLAEETGGKLLDSHQRDSYSTKLYSFKIGAEISVSPVFEWARECFDASARIKSAAESLRKASEFMEREIPTALVPPPAGGGILG